MKISVLGAGSWGTTLACLLANNGHNVYLWEINEQAAQKLNEERVIPFIGGATIPKNVVISSDLNVVNETEAVLFVVPSHFLRSTVMSIKKLNIDLGKKLIISATKGIENETLLRVSQIIEEIYPETKNKIVALSGPSHAEEVSKQIPTVVTSASKNEELAIKVRDLFMNDYFRVYTQDDIVGVELGASLKNVFAVAGGIIDGLNFGDNTKAAIISRGLKELISLGVALGGKEKTFYGLSGVGDLMVTCFSKHSRNRNLGEMLAKGKTLEQAEKELKMVAEGVKTCKSAYQLGKNLNIELPIINQVYEVLFKNKDAKQAVYDLMTRTPKAE
ncbi:NAD(P)H-dependent glycerol-3-phosphate dehydrogenase [Candidatus Ruminimicrobiellum ovillum]|uniref:NAD(P)H-dependent glycerol-3-phosphate dehydrogenase n=1 Tax=Candidatus Ruminimicrobiellum ovillum TaxID=1947927 RepID=UPI00355A4D62